jgi:arylsulfatase A-like enzyme
VQSPWRKILLVVVDGLRPDVITEREMPQLTRLMARGWRAERAVTVRPSITVAALTSLATGVAPATHGLTDAGLRSLGRLRGLRPLPAELRRVGVMTTVVLPQLTGSARWIAGALLRLGGVGRLALAAPAPASLVETAVRQIRGNREREFVVLYLNDLDLAGHAWGWMSPAYRQTAGIIDRALGQLLPLVEDPSTLIIVTADHGGGGVLPQDHDHPHPINDGIPIALLGGGVTPGAQSPDPVSLLDIPPTVLHGFGSTIPPQYQGRVLHEAYATELVCV